MNSFKIQKLGDLINVQNGYAFKATDLQNRGIPVIKIKNIQPPNISLNDSEYYPFELTERLKQFLVQKKDILISMTGSHVSQISSAVGKVGRYGFDKSSLLNQRIGRVYSKDISQLNNDYLYYFISRPEIQFELATNAGGSANQANISPQDIKALEIDLPDILSQTRIASILSALDDKIELNRRMNHTLEQMAQTLFKKYFVDDIDPDNLPEGWTILPIGDLFEFTIGGDWGKEKHDEVHNIKTAIIRGTDFSALQTGQFQNIPVRFIKEPNFLKRKLADGDIIFEISGGSTDQPTGRSTRISKNILESLGRNAVPASFCRVIRPKNKIIGYYVFLYLQNLYDEGGTWEYQNQSTGISNFQFTYFSEKEKVVIPNDSTHLEQFAKLAEPLYLKMESNVLEMKKLTEIRDSILPKLMSGEIEVS